MATCEKYRREVSLDEPICPDPETYCKFREACLIYAGYEEKAENLDNKENNNAS